MQNKLRSKNHIFRLAVLQWAQSLYSSSVVVLALPLCQLRAVDLCGRWSKLFCLFVCLPAPFRETCAFCRAHSGAHMVDNPPSTTPLKPCVKGLLWEPTTQPECYFPMPKTGFGVTQSVYSQGKTHLNTFGHFWLVACKPTQHLPKCYFPVPKTGFGGCPAL